MTHFPRAKVLAIAIAASAAFGLAGGNAHADVLATSVIQLTNFTLTKTNAAGAILDYVNDFQIITFNNTGDVGAQYNGIGPTAASGSGTPLNLAIQCAGPSCAGPNTPPAGLSENGFQNLTSAGLIGTFSAADQNESGAPITSLPGGAAIPAKIESGAWGQIIAPTGGTTTSTSNNGLIGKFRFKLAQATAISFNFDATYGWEAYVSADEPFPSGAQTRANVNFNIVNLNTNTKVFNLTPTELNWNESTSAPTFGFNSKSGSGTVNYNVATPLLNDTDLYEYTFSTQTLADTTSVIPEPGSLVLVGTLLVGLGLSRRRHQSNAQA